VTDDVAAGLPDFTALPDAAARNGHGPASPALVAAPVAPAAPGGPVPAVTGGDEALAEAPADVDDLAWTADTDALGTPDDPLTTARAVEPRWRNEAGLLTCRRWRDEWLTWTGTCWEPAEEAELRRQLYELLERARYWGTTGRGAPVVKSWAPTRAKVTNVLDALAAVAHTPAKVEMPGWVTAGDGSGGTPIACANVLLDPVTGVTRPHTAAYLNATALPFAHDPAATCPRWDAFLASAFPDDEASTTLLREWFGYVVSGRTDQQKMLYLVGSQRSGKGVISRVLTRLIGKENVAAPTLNGFATNFGLSSLIGKPLAVIADARSSARLDAQLVVERLLMITGEDALDVDRKNRAIWTGRLPTRLVMASN
jgi:putative DNA primase/helicase